MVLDQPEDDLDNRLVYELIVDRLRKSKEHRQIIVVTHNANIPVNGDTEYSISMVSKSENISVYKTGTVEDIYLMKFGFKFFNHFYLYFNRGKNKIYLETIFI